jgi:hypothetical protein
MPSFKWRRNNFPSISKICVLALSSCMFFTPHASLLDKVWMLLHHLWEILNLMHGEPVDHATAIGSSEGPMQKKCQHSKFQVRFFEPLEVPLESIDERGDFDRHDMSEHDEPDPGTSIDDSREEHSVGA